MRLSREDPVASAIDLKSTNTGLRDKTEIAILQRPNLIIGFRYFNQRSLMQQTDLYFPKPSMIKRNNNIDDTNYMSISFFMHSKDNNAVKIFYDSHSFLPFLFSVNEK